MQTYTLPVCGQCRRALARQFHTTLPNGRSSKSTKAYRKAQASGTVAFNVGRLAGPAPIQVPFNHKAFKARRPGPLIASKPPDSESIRRMVLQSLPTWKTSHGTIGLLTSLGLQPQEAQALLNEYELHIEREVRSELLKGEDPWSIAHLLNAKALDKHVIADRVLTMRLFAFAAQPGRSIRGVTDPSMLILQQANTAFDLRYPAEIFTLARRMQRKIILHVGPTNSGKTYNALRALASARSGVYAGPLRLLAHEVWERLNRGSIRPHDAGPEEAYQYARECNLITGEEQRIVTEIAPLISCTVEMINLYGQYEVCVIDEIQMIADPDRGHAWTSALLGVSANVIHLCGEEAAVPLITELVKETGDDLEVKHYERLTPLVVAEKSLEGHWNRIQKGDCIVTFSRSSIFSLKRIVEESTGLRCAVAYGRLPPETRSEQAVLFNAADSGYDVMVASDAIGMGLNLKIKRVVFVQLKKFNGIREIPLSLSQIKQIGGRAGRFGEHGDSSSAGIVTCLHSGDLPTLVKAFETQAPALERAYLPLHNSVLNGVAQSLPQKYGLKALHDALSVAGRIGENYSMPDMSSKFKAMNVIDHFGRDLQLHERMQFLMAPTSWRSELEFDVFVRYLQQFIKGSTVDLRQALQDTGLLETLEIVAKARSRHKTQSIKEAKATDYDVQTSSTLALLETLYKTLVTYAWLSFRIPISFSQREDANKLKLETEEGIEFVLEGIANVKKQKRIRTKSLRELREETVVPEIHYSQKKTPVPRILQRTGVA